MLNQVLSPVAKKLRELQQTYKHRTLNSKPDTSGNIYGQMTFFGAGANVCGKNENHDIISELKYQFHKTADGWTEQAQLAGCDNSSISLKEVIEVRLATNTPVETDLSATRMSQADILSGKRIIHLQKNEISRKYAIYNSANHPILSFVSVKTTEGVQIQVLLGTTLMVSAHVKESDGGESFIYRKSPFRVIVNFGFWESHYIDESTETILTRKFSQGTSYYDQEHNEELSYAKTMQKIEGFLVTSLASLYLRQNFEYLMDKLFPTATALAQPSCLRNELLRLEAQLRTSNASVPAIQEILNTYLPLWRKALDSGELNDSRSLPCK